MQCNLIVQVVEMTLYHCFISWHTLLQMNTCFHKMTKKVNLRILKISKGLRRLKQLSKSVKNHNATTL